MSIATKILRAIGFKSYIKIPGKGFGDLSRSDLASMIEAFIEDGNEEFEQNALYEFRLMTYKKPHLKETRDRILEIEQQYRKSDSPDGLETLEGKAALRNLSQELRGSDLQP